MDFFDWKESMFIIDYENISVPFSSADFIKKFTTSEDKFVLSTFDNELFCFDCMSTCEDLSDYIRLLVTFDLPSIHAMV